MAPLTVILLTAATCPERAEYAYATIHAVLDNLRYSGPLHVHIADDGSPDEHRSILRAIAGGYAHIASVTETNAEGGGYGASYNRATQAVHSRGGYFLPLEDDWLLMHELDADALVAALDGAIGCIRLGYLGFTQRLKGELVHEGEHNYLLFDRASEEPHVWAGHPRIEDLVFERAVGEWPIGLDPGTTEFVVSQRPAARERVAWPLDLVGGYGRLFAHVGAIQARSDQREASSV